MSKRFPEIAQRAFSFLEHSGFSLTHTAPSEVHYESARSFIATGWDIRSGELEVLLGLQPRTGRPQDTYTLTDLLAMAGSNVSDGNLTPQVLDQSRLRLVVDQLACEVKNHAQPALAGDRMFFRRLEAFRHAKAEALTQGIKLRQVRSAVEDAWKSVSSRGSSDCTPQSRANLPKPKRAN